VRNFGLGVNNAFSRIGGLLSPYALLARHLAWPYGPELIFAVLSLVAAALVFLLPHDKKGGCIVLAVLPAQQQQQQRQHANNSSATTAEKHGSVVSAQTQCQCVPRSAVQVGMLPWMLGCPVNSARNMTSSTPLTAVITV
jgi:hypothetical protein